MTDGLTSPEELNSLPEASGKVKAKKAALQLSPPAPTALIPPIPIESGRRMTVAEKKELSYVDSLLGKFEERFASVPEEDKGMYLDLLRLVFFKGNPVQVGRAHKLLLGNLDKMGRGLNEPVKDIVFKLIGSQNHRQRVDGGVLLDAILLKYGFDPFKAREAWDVSAKQSDRTSTYEKNFLKVLSLEKERPGICQFLQEEYGICDFARYPEELLIDQYEQRDNTELPYGVLLYPRVDNDDENGGAFYYTRRALKKLQDDLKGRYTLRLAECKSKHDIARTLIKLDRKYGQNNKISFAIVAGHGSPLNIQFGDLESKSDSITKREVKERERIGSIRDLFEKDPKVILISCSTGKKRGIGHELSRLGADVDAPDKDTMISHLIVNFGQDGKLSRLEPVYREGKTQKYAAGKPQHF